jgi:hypothetical protein
MVFESFPNTKKHHKNSFSGKNLDSYQSQVVFGGEKTASQLQPQQTVAKLSMSRAILTLFAIISLILTTMLGLAFQNNFKRTIPYRKKGIFDSQISSTISSPTNANRFSTSANIPSHPSFEQLSRSKIVEYGVEAIHYRHKKSRAEVLSIIAPQDENKVFGITFRTPPKVDISKVFYFHCQSILL